jgi:4-amino-4-deoxy-L-arabinose transferase-like glycosyltransferase
MLQKIHAKLNKYFAWLDITLLLLLTVYILSGINLVPFHGDESAFILMSEDYDKIVKQGDLRRVLFNPEGSTKQYIRLSTGSILAFSIGFARDITNTEGPMNKWLWGASWEENIMMGNMPSFQLLRLARTCSALMGALSIVLFFITARQLLSSRLAAWTATLVLATHGDILVNFRRAMQEGPKFFFLILTLYIASLVLKDFQSMNTRRYLYVLLGIASGLILATKQDTAPMLIAVYLALALIPIWKKETVRTILINFLYLGAATILAFACFLAFMPVFWAWWKSVVVLTGFATILFQLPVWKTDRAAKPLALAGCVFIIWMTISSPMLWRRFPAPVIIMIETRESIIGGQVKNYKDNNPFYFNTAKDRMKFLLETTLTSKAMYMEAPSFDIPPVHEQITAYEDSFLSGRTGSLLADGFIAVLVVIGGWALLRQFNAESLFVYSLLITTGILLFAMVPLPWQRYFLIMQIPYALIAGAGVNQLWNWGKFNEHPINKKN